MKILPYLLINLVMVGGGIAVYDTLKGEGGHGSSAAGGGVDPVDLVQVEASILEKLRGDRPALLSAGTDPRVLDRIAALEKAQGLTPPAVPADEPDAPGDRPAETFARPETTADGVEPSDEEVKRFRKLMDRAEEMRRDEREMERLNTMLQRLEISLDEGQKRKFVAAQRAHFERIRDVWRTARQDGNGGGREAARDAMEGLREQFTTELTKFMSVGDAQKITEQSGRMMRGWGGDVGARRAPPAR